MSFLSKKPVSILIGVMTVAALGATVYASMPQEKQLDNQRVEPVEPAYVAKEESPEIEEVTPTVEETVVETPVEIAQAPVEQPLKSDDIYQTALVALQNDPRGWPQWMSNLGNVRHFARSIADHAESQSLTPTANDVEGYASKCVDFVYNEISKDPINAESIAGVSARREPCWLH